MQFIKNFSLLFAYLFCAGPRGSIHQSGFEKFSMKNPVPYHNNFQYRIVKNHWDKAMTPFFLYYYYYFFDKRLETLTRSLTPLTLNDLIKLFRTQTKILKYIFFRKIKIHI